METVTIPQEKNAEGAILGLCMSSFQELNKIMESATDMHFYDYDHRVVFNAIRTIYQSQGEVNTNSVGFFLHDKGSLQKLPGGHGFIQMLIQMANSIDTEYYMDILQQAYVKRQLLNIGMDVAKRAAAKMCDATHLLEETQSKLSEITTSKETKSFHIKEIAEGKHREDKTPILQVMEIERALMAQGKMVLPGLETGWTALDKAIGGLVDGHLVIVGARPGCGKSTFCLNMMRTLGIKNQSPVAFFSLEMNSEECFMKLLSMESTVCYSKLRDRNFSTTERDLFIEPSIHKVAGGHIYIEDQQNMPIDTLISRARRLKELYGIKAIFIDYLGYITTTLHKNNKVEQVSSICAQLKGLAKSLSVPVVCICQLSRAGAVEKRGPIMSDLRDSGQIEANADEIILLHRPEQEDSNSMPGKLEVILEKNRFGPRERFESAFDGKTGIISTMMTKSEIRKSVAHDAVKIKESTHFDRFMPCEP